MRLRDAELVAIDFESTGVVGAHPNEPWQLGMVWITGGTVTGRACSQWLRVGERPFNRYAPGQHHQLRAELAAAPTLGELWPELQGWWLGHPLVAHNIGTERSFLTQAAPLHALGPWIDTLQVARHVYPRLPAHGLEVLLDHLGLMGQVAERCPGLLPHDALFDAVGCAVLLIHFLSLPGWAEVEVEALVGLSATVYRQERRRGRSQN